MWVQRDDNPGFVKPPSAPVFRSSLRETANSDPSIERLLKLVMKPGANDDMVTAIESWADSFLNASTHAAEKDAFMQALQLGSGQLFDVADVFSVVASETRECLALGIGFVIAEFVSRQDDETRQSVSAAIRNHITRTVKRMIGEKLGVCQYIQAYVKESLATAAEKTANETLRIPYVFEIDTDAAEHKYVDVFAFDGTVVNVQIDSLAAPQPMEIEQMMLLADGMVDKLQLPNGSVIRYRPRYQDRLATFLAEFPMLQGVLQLPFALHMNTLAMEFTDNQLPKLTTEYKQFSTTTHVIRQDSLTSEPAAGDNVELDVAAADVATSDAAALDVTTADVETSDAAVPTVGGNDKDDVAEKVELERQLTEALSKIQKMEANATAASVNERRNAGATVKIVTAEPVIEVVIDASSERDILNRLNSASRGWVVVLESPSMQTNILYDFSTRVCLVNTNGQEYVFPNSAPSTANDKVKTILQSFIRTYGADNQMLLKNIALLERQIVSMQAQASVPNDDDDAPPLDSEITLQYEARIRTLMAEMNELQTANRGLRDEVAVLTETARSADTDGASVNLVRSMATKYGLWDEDAMAMKSESAIQTMAEERERSLREETADRVSQLTRDSEEQSQREIRELEDKLAAIREDLRKPLEEKIALVNRDLAEEFDRVRQMSEAQQREAMESRAQLMKDMADARQFVVTQY